MTNILPQSAFRSQPDNGPFRSLLKKGNPDRSMKKLFINRVFGIIFLSAFVALPQQVLSQATVTDPAAANPLYQATKVAKATTGARKSIAPVTGKAPARMANTAIPAAGIQAGSLFRSGGSCFIPNDASYTGVPINDDGSYGPIALGFDFNLYGTIYNEVYINTNGNLTFNSPLAMYNPYGFPFYVPMVAGFWGDVDTNEGGQIFFKQTATSLIVTWDGVHSYGSDGISANTFQIILTDGLDPLLGAGRNVALNHLNMEWAFGAATSFESATVGINDGNDVNFVQVGRFLFNNNLYDGPGGNNDGIYYLNGLCSVFNVGNSGNIEPSSSNLPQNKTVTLNVGQTVTINPQFIGPETDQNITTTVNTNGMCGVTSSVTNGSVSTASLTINGSACNVGTHTITLSATDDGVPAKTNVETITVHVISPCNTALSATKTDVTCLNGTNGSVNLTVTGGTAPFTYSWTNGATTEDLSNVAAGTYSVTVTDANNCTATTKITVNETAVAFTPTISVSRLGSNVYTGANENSIFLGYGNQMVSLNAAGGVSYAWQPAAGLSNTSIANPVFAPTAAGTYTFNVTATNAAGCQATASVTITVIDARTGSTQNKVVICHKGNLINVSASSVAAHLAHGCSIGACGATLVRSAAFAAEETTLLEAFPNPFAGQTNVEFSLPQDSRYSLEVMDLKGTLVKKVAEGNAKAGMLQVHEVAADKLAEGIYLIRLVTETEVKYLKLMLKK